jgi:UDP-N-acetyl-D-galactosamine dehydrogenase
MLEIATKSKQTIKLMIKKSIKIINSKILILGFTFKENCPDVRNTKVLDIIKELNTYQVEITIVDPLANAYEVIEEYNIVMQSNIPENEKFDSIILAVAHSNFINIKIHDYLKPNSVLFDVKGILEKKLTDGRL